jgi:hypothetical protein
MAGWLGASASVESADPLWASDGSGAATASLAPEGPALASPDRSFAGGLRLEPPRPNPLSLSTTLVIRSDRSTVGRMEVFDVTGRLVKTLLAGAPIPAGGLSIVWDGSTDRGESAAAGVYVIRLRATGASLQQRVIRLK